MSLGSNFSATDFIFMAALMLSVGVAIITIPIGKESKDVGSKDLIPPGAIPSRVIELFRRENPHLNDKQIDMAFLGLRQYFSIHQMLQSKRGAPLQNLGMPSVLIDEAWHCFMLCTREYQAFCDTNFGRFLHHSPNPAAKPGKVLKTTNFDAPTKSLWRAIRSPQGTGFMLAGGVPLIFAADALGGIVDGWIWTNEAMSEIDSQVRKEDASSGGGAGGPSPSAGSCSCCSSGCGGD